VSLPFTYIDRGGVLNVGRTFNVPTESMTPTILPGDRIRIDPDAYDFEDPPKVGDIIVFTWPKDPRVPYVKRVTRVARAGEYWVEGDNKEKSQDSRNFGTVPLKDVRGKVVGVVYSLGPDHWPRWDRTLIDIRGP
jgi:signal peptidase I